MTREQLIQELEDFGFSIEDHGCGHLLIHNHNDIVIGIEMRTDDLHYNILDEKNKTLGTVVFSYDMIKTKILKDGDTFTISSLDSKGNSCIFINLYKF